MKTMKSTVTAKGIDMYFIPPQWGEVSNVYLVPFISANTLRKKPESALARYKVEFVVLPPDKDNKANPVFRRLQLRDKPDGNYVLVAAVNLVEKN